MKTRPCGSKIAPGFQVAWAFRDLSEEPNQGTLLRLGCDGAGSVLWERWRIAALPK